MNDNVLKRYLYMKKTYKDPDGYGNDPDYYKEYCDLLNNRSKYIGNPKNIEYVLEKEKKGGYSIVIKKDGTKSIKMKSDQFGFSFAAIYSNKFHPYDAYLLLFDDKDLEKKDKNSPFEKVKYWVSKTRQVGGSFLWPFEDNIYNGARGGVCNSKRNKKARGSSRTGTGIYIEFYIQDRVDLTLFEIKEVYESNILKIEKLSKKEKKDLYDGKNVVLKYDKKYLIDNSKLKKNNLMACLFDENGNPTKIYEFLSLFGDDKEGFKYYVDYFAFNDFVCSDMIVDIYRKNNKYIDNRVGMIRKYNGEINDYTKAKLEDVRSENDYESSTSIKEFEYMFDSLVDLINKRRNRLLFPNSK